MNGKLCIFQKFPINFPTLFPTFTFDVVFKKKPVQKSFIVGSILFPILSKSTCRLYLKWEKVELCVLNFSRSNTGLVYFPQLSTTVNWVGENWSFSKVIQGLLRNNVLIVQNVFVLRQMRFMIHITSSVLYEAEKFTLSKTVQSS